MISLEMKKKLTEMAVSASENSYSPYSNFCVGAALLCPDGRIYTGTNVENSSYGACNCAERTAIFAAVADGYRKFDAIAIIGHRRGESISEACPPCGICRQVIAEFADSDFPCFFTTARKYSNISFPRFCRSYLIRVCFD